MEAGSEDRVTVYKAKDGWRWRRRAPNGEIVAESGEAYVRYEDAADGAKRQGVEVTPPSTVPTEE